MKNRHRLIVITIPSIALLLGLYIGFRTVSPDSAQDFVPDLFLTPIEDSINHIPINHILSDTLSDIPEAEKMDRQIEQFMRQWEINGASLAIMKDEKLIYAKGYGWADKEREEKVEVKHIFRIASVSKLITAVGIMKLSEEGRLSLSDKPFSNGGVMDLPQFGDIIKDKQMRNITIEHLLRHQAGFSLGNGDPMFNIPLITQKLGLDTTATNDDIIAYSLSRRLGFAPGTSTTYSNLGYVILSRIIEIISGNSYEEYIRANILHPAGVYDMHIAKNLYEERYENEVKYYEPQDSEPIYAYNRHDTLLPRSYGGNNIEGLLGAGAWVASPGEILKFVTTIDGKDNIPDILSPESIELMNSTSTSMLPIGWSKSIKGNRSRTGALSGSSAILKYNEDGYSWFFVTNTSSWRGSKFPTYIESLFLKTLPKVSEWPQHNLFDIDSLINVASN